MHLKLSGCVCGVCVCGCKCYIYSHFLSKQAKYHEVFLIRMLLIFSNNLYNYYYYYHYYYYYWTDVIQTPSFCKVRATGMFFRAPYLSMNTKVIRIGGLIMNIYERNVNLSPLLDKVWKRPLVDLCLSNTNYDVFKSLTWCPSLSSIKRKQAGLPIFARIHIEDITTTKAFLTNNIYFKIQFTSCGFQTRR